MLPAHAPLAYIRRRQGILTPKLLFAPVAAQQRSGQEYDAKGMS